MDGGNTTAVPQRATQTRTQIESLQAMTTRLEECLDNLRAMLNPVLNQPKPTDPTDTKDRLETFIVPMAVDIKAIRVRVAECVNGIVDLTERLEV